MSQSKGAINSCQQLVYLSEWFAEMSEMQTQDFMTHLVHKYSHSCDQLTDNAVINGLNRLGMSDRPASIFQCRLKLLDEWFAQWSDEEKAELLIRLRNINSRFMDEFQANLDTGSHTPSETNDAVTDDYQCQQMNGNIDDDRKSTEQLAVNGFNGHSDDSLVDIEVEVNAIDVNTTDVNTTDDQMNDNDVSVEEVDGCVQSPNDETIVNNVVNESTPEVVCG